jgi:hypothetical protein
MMRKDQKPHGRRRPIVAKPVARPERVPLELTGKWVAWSSDGLKILGHGESISEARASAGGAPGLMISWIPPIEELRPERQPPATLPA